MTYRTLDRLRRGSQVAVLVFIVAVPVLGAMGVHAVVGTLYSMSIGPVDIADPAMTLQTTLLTRELFVPLLLAAAIPIVLAVAFGRIFCSWMCPFNTLHEWLESARRRLFGRRAVRRPSVPSNPRPLLYWGILAGLLMLVLLTDVPLLVWLSAPGIISSQVGHIVFRLGPGLELGLVAGVLVAEVALARRFWCKYACPVGATLSLFRTTRTLRVVRDASACTCRPGGEACRTTCPLGLLPDRDGIEPFCFNCGSCLRVCEKTKRSALRFSFGDAGAADAPAGAARPAQDAAALTT
jgi:ferredoxin-type protein NapH